MGFLDSVASGIKNAISVPAKALGAYQNWLHDNGGGVGNAPQTTFGFKNTPTAVPTTDYSSPGIQNAVKNTLDTLYERHIEEPVKAYDQFNPGTVGLASPISTVPAAANSVFTEAEGLANDFTDVIRPAARASEKAADKINPEAKESKKKFLNQPTDQYRQAIFNGIPNGLTLSPTDSEPIMGTANPYGLRVAGPRPEINAMNANGSGHNIYADEELHIEDVNKNNLATWRIDDSFNDFMQNSDLDSVKNYKLNVLGDENADVSFSNNWLDLAMADDEHADLARDVISDWLATDHNAGNAYERDFGIDRYDLGNGNPYDNVYVTKEQAEAFYDAQRAENVFEDLVWFDPLADYGDDQRYMDMTGNFDNAGVSSRFLDVVNQPNTTQNAANKARGLTAEEIANDGAGIFLVTEDGRTFAENAGFDEVLSNPDFDTEEGRKAYANAVARDNNMFKTYMLGQTIADGRNKLDDGTMRNVINLGSTDEEIIANLNALLNNNAGGTNTINFALEDTPEGFNSEDMIPDVIDVSGDFDSYVDDQMAHAGDISPEYAAWLLQNVASANGGNLYDAGYRSYRMH